MLRYSQGFAKMFAVRNSSCGKVMFSETCQEFCPQEGEGCLPLGLGVYCPLGKYPQVRHPLSQADTAQADTLWVWGGGSRVHLQADNPPRQTSPRQTPPPPRDSHCGSGRYTSYWNAFLLYGSLS